MSEREPISFEQAVSMLPEGEEIHTVRTSMGGIRLGANWQRKDILDYIRKHGAEKAGPVATSCGHGLFIDDGRGLFVETREEKP